jgi:hypothetical protein
MDSPHSSAHGFKIHLLFGFDFAPSLAEDISVYHLKDPFGLVNPPDAGISVNV